jgi:hypothetical protein
MATVANETSTEQIGETAGLVWHTLNQQGSLSLAKLPKLIDAPKDVVMQAVGWLAREDKIDIEEVGRTKQISLREVEF